MRTQLDTVDLRQLDVHTTSQIRELDINSQTGRITRRGIAMAHKALSGNIVEKYAAHIQRLQVEMAAAESALASLAILDDDTPTDKIQRNLNDILQTLDTNATAIEQWRKQPAFEVLSEWRDQVSTGLAGGQGFPSGLGNSHGQ